MKNMKKATALVLIAALTFTLMGTAFAGSIFETLINAGKTVWNGMCTAGHAVAGTAEYIFTDSTAAKAYTGTMKAAKDTADSAMDTAHSTMQIGKDAVDVAKGIEKVGEGVVDLMRSGNMNSAMHYITGKGDVDRATWEAMEKMVKGYDQMDNGLILDCVKLVPGVGGIVAGCAEAIKNEAEYATGHITEEKYQEGKINAAIDMLTGAAGGAAGAVVEGTGAKLAVKAAGVAVNKGLKELAD